MTMKLKIKGQGPRGGCRASEKKYDDDDDDDDECWVSYKQ
jgi:hypothetical protein